METGAESVDAAHRLLADEYGLEFRLVMGVERVLRRGPVDRVIVRITPNTPDGHREP
ncbi:hypothetical protein [Phycicoccus sp. HDW14]|uniref:hypothetical protein n=1 Tax=Phycicoccus sp. HDW14 TaxID=2714941 RepID=UPI00197BA12E|nr:hypothetical protein [Phycicoccus sp. HDW14]